MFASCALAGHLTVDIGLLKNAKFEVVLRNEFHFHTFPRYFMS